MKPIAIHDRKTGFAPGWIDYCRRKNLPHEVVDCCTDEFAQKVGSYSAILYNWVLHDPHDLILGPMLIQVAEIAGIPVFPTWRDCWAYDDKLPQGLVLDMLGLRTPKTRVFVDEAEALGHLKRADYPLVIKLRRGAGSSNVWLLKTHEEAVALARRAFGRGFSPFPSPVSDAKTKFSNLGATKKGRMEMVKKLPAAYRRWRRRRALGMVERGYLLVQEFLPKNEFDTRVTIIGDRAFGFTRWNRPGDFRASGSGKLDYESEVDKRCIQTAFKASAALGADCMAYDFLFDRDGEPSIVEFSYAYLPDAVAACKGHWNHNLEWIPGPLRPEDCIIETVILPKLLEAGYRP